MAAAPLGAAEVEYPLAIAVDEARTVYLADRQLPGVWRLAEGKLSLLFEGSKKFRTPLNAVRCLAIDRDGRLLAGDSATRDVYRFGTDDKPVALTKGQIGIPACMAVLKSGDLLVGDLEAQRIWQVPSAGGDPTLWSAVQAPRALFVDREDKVWIVSHGKDQLLRGSSDGKIEVVAGGRPFEFPSAVAVDAAGVAYVCDTYAKAVWKVSAGNMPVKWAAGEPLVSPVGMTWDGDNLVVVDPRAKALIRIDPAGKMSKTDLTAAPVELP